MTRRDVVGVRRRRRGLVGDALPVLAFESGPALRRWLEENHARSDGIWVRIHKRGTGVAGATFEEVLEQGLCFGWSESTRRRFDDASYLQRFAPRPTTGTTSARNRALARQLLREGQMTAAGLAALGMRAEAVPAPVVRPDASDRGVPSAHRNRGTT